MQPNYRRSTHVCKTDSVCCERLPSSASGICRLRAKLAAPALNVKIVIKGIARLGFEIGCFVGKGTFYSGTETAKRLQIILCFCSAITHGGLPV
jgi:hypothetical protein